MNKSRLIFFLIISLIFASPVFVNAQVQGSAPQNSTQGSASQTSTQGSAPTTGTVQGSNLPLKIEIPNPLKPGINNLYEFIVAIVKNVIVPLGAVAAVISIIYSGFLFVTAQGNEDKLKNAKNAFMYSVIGSAILLGAWVIAEGIGATIKSLGIGI